MRQRVMIAMALVLDPALLIADEPTTALDVTVQAQIMQLLEDLQAESGTGLILITHGLGVVNQVADKVAVMYAGRIVEEGTVDEVFSNPLPVHRRSDEVDPAGRAPWPAADPNPGYAAQPRGHPLGCAFHPRCPRGPLRRPRARLP